MYKNEKCSKMQKYLSVQKKCALETPLPAERGVVIDGYCLGQE